MVSAVLLILGLLVIVLRVSNIHDGQACSERIYDSLYDSCTTLSSDSPVVGPNISWFPDPNVTMAIDGYYNGQNQEIFDYWVWVNDSLGVDSVIFRFKWSNDEKWLNRTTGLIEGDEFHGRYKGNLTWPAPGGGNFQFKVFANNTLGYWNETSPMSVWFGYLYWNPIYTPHFWILFVILPLVSLIGLVGVWKLRQKRTLSWTHVTSAHKGLWTVT
ncbi:MAG: hypothetical protein AM325_005940 [Candidatus Thorarchaeota archaeon SMTZ1-45]|nr:MAG: hypothetical protein AM325_07690 [Candidatus Thorarchaeota archaeon SMTZ1-45]